MNTITAGDLNAYTKTEVNNALSSKADSSSLATVAISGSYNDLSDKPTIPTVPTNVSSFANDAGYLTQHQDISGKAEKSEMSVTTNNDETTITLKSGLSATVINQHQDISGKQDVIPDLTAIRSGADLGRTALQSLPPISLGNLSNVNNITDVVDVEGNVLYKQADSNEWTALAVGDLLGLLEPVSTAVRVVDQMGSTTQEFYKTSSTAYISFMVTSRQKDNQVASPAWEDTGERVNITIEKRLSDGTWTSIGTMANQATNTTLQYNVRASLNVGDNLIRFSAEGMNTGVTSPYLVYECEIVVVYPTISLSALEWQTPQMGAISVPILYGGEMNKTLHIDVLDDTGDTILSSPYTSELGTRTSTSVAVPFSVVTPTVSGVYTIMAWITTDDSEVNSPTVGANILWLAEDAVGKWLITNNVTDGLTNWSDNNVIDYVLYDTAGTSSSILFTLYKDNVEVYSSALTSVDRTRHTLVIPLELDESQVSFNVALDATEIEDTTTSYGKWTLPVDNTVNYSAVSGAVFQLNPKTRTNSDSNWDTVENYITGEEVATVLTNMPRTNTSMWTTDASGEKCLQVNAGQKVWFDINPFENNVAQGNGVTIEFDYKIDNVSDYDAVGIDISQASGTTFMGLRIGANKMQLNTQATHSDDIQELILDDGVRIRGAVTIVPRAYTFQDTNGNTMYLNLVRYYINGKINRAFEIQNTDVLQLANGITIGSDDCDVTLYSMRVYEQKLDFKSEHQNFVNILPTVEEKAEEKTFNDIYDNDEISFAKVRQRGLNAFVTDKPFPSLNVDEDYDLGGNTDRKDVTLELYILTAINNYIKTHPTRQGGQGTSSMRYWEWNQRLRMLKNTVITYGVNGEIVDTTTQKINIWDFLPKVADLTMKKNWASSMQDHKAGSVNTLTDVWKHLGYTNAASEEDEKVRISVYQEPFVGWYKKTLQDGTIKYVCMGNFTGGPHKGDKKCFGYDLDMFPGILSMEGCNNDPVLTNFKMPWDDTHVMVDTSDDILVMYRTGFDQGGNAQWTKAWEQDFGGIEEGDSNAVATEKLADFIDAYNDIYQYNPYVAPWEGTVAQLNAAAAQWKADLDNGQISQAEYATKIGTEYWLADAGDSQYDLYCYDPSTGEFYLSTVNGVKQNVGQYLS